MDPSTMPEAAPPRELAGWLREGARSAVLLRPDWRGLRATPLRVALLLALAEAVVIALGRLQVEGEASFYWQAVYGGWISTCVLALLCWGVTGAARAAVEPPRPSGTTLFALLCAQAVVLDLAIGLAFAALARLDGTPGAAFLPQRADADLVALGWVALAQVRLLWRGAPARWWPRALAAVLAAGAVFLDAEVYPVSFWYPEETAAERAADQPLALTQELMEAQPALLAGALDALAPQRRGVVDLYAITFAPYASQDVFMRESAMVAGVMAQRFDAQGRVVQLVNNKATAADLPWATPLNLQRAIAAAARRMDRAEDVLFIHLTSHGGADGRLAMDFDPMTLDDVTPQLLKSWLDEAGVRWRVISISACFSGSWVAPLADEGTLVMTAADADHTSYGCGSRSPLTFFGQAMYDEQLRRDTRSFEQAFATARKVIDQRERAAAKDDGYSNPQISMGAAIRARLVALEAQLAAREALGAAAAR